MVTRITVLALLAGSTTMLGASLADAGQVKYVGVHPAAANGVCHIEAPHVHTYLPEPKSKRRRALLYRVHDGSYHFVGDPAAIDDYEGPRVAYYGHHPIAVDVVAGVHVEGAPHHIDFCYLAGPHHHHYEPAADLEFTTKGDAFWYVGTYPANYEELRPRLVKINAIYKPIKYQRPEIVVEPPPAYRGPVVGVQANFYASAPAAHAVVAVDVPAPSMDFSFGFPSVFVEGHHHVGHRRNVKYRKHRKHKKFRKHRKRWKKHRRKRHKKWRWHHDD